MVGGQKCRLSSAKETQILSKMSQILLQMGMWKEGGNLLNTKIDKKALLETVYDSTDLGKPQFKIKVCGSPIQSRAAAEAVLM